MDTLQISILTAGIASATALGLAAINVASSFTLKKADQKHQAAISRLQTELQERKGRRDEIFKIAHDRLVLLNSGLAACQALKDLISRILLASKREGSADCRSITDDLTKARSDLEGIHQRLIAEKRDENKAFHRAKTIGQRIEARVSLIFHDRTHVSPIEDSDCDYLRDQRRELNDIQDAIRVAYQEQLLQLVASGTAE